MAIKLIATDLDGTFLNAKREIPAENIKAAQEAAAKGVIFTIATGRMYGSAKFYAEQVGVDVPIITYNGALVMTVEGRELSNSYLEAQEVIDTLRYAQGKGWLILNYEDDQIYVPFYDDRVSGYEENARQKAHVVGWDGLYAHTKRVPKLLLITSGVEETDARAAEIRAALDNRVSATRSVDAYAEIVSPKASKAIAIEALARSYGISMDEVMVCGDSENDRSMLEAAGTAVVMGNAKPHIKALATYVTGSCDEAGVAQAIRKFVL
ncbi:Cof-type HAD-IIB family hydrolase [Selenomonas sp. TAMA-11512]|nr:Cof-type HAD-IIB family hydrolase [Selenomonas sp. TAMA-11512]